MTVFARASNVESTPVKRGVLNYKYGVSHEFTGHALKFTDFSLLDRAEGLVEGSLSVVLTTERGKSYLILAESYEQVSDGVYEVPEYQIVECAG